VAVCQIHSNLEINVFCKTHMKALCPSCVVDHMQMGNFSSSHTLVNIEKALMDIQEDMQREFNSFEEFL
jgi:hypothetical protein